MPLVITGYEPGSGWSLSGERVYAKAPPGTKVFAEYADVRVLAIAGHDLWASINMDQLHAKLSAGGHGYPGLWIYYMSLWRNPPNPIIGFDDYRCITVHR